MVNCPQCDTAIDVDEEELDEGDALICEDCGANLNVVGTDPLELSSADADEDEDDNDEDEDDDDFDEDDEDDEEDDDEDDDDDDE